MASRPVDVGVLKARGIDWIIEDGGRKGGLSGEKMYGKLTQRCFEKETVGHLFLIK